jgi:nucleoporin POM152
MFNNSIPDQVSYFVRSLETGETETKTVSGFSLRKSSHSDQQLEITDDEENEAGQAETDPLSALVLRTQGKEVAKMPSVKPADSLALIPQQLASSQSILFLTIDRPSLVSLKSVVDKRGDRFQITPHKEAVVIECPTGGHFMNQEQGTMIKKGDKIQPAEQRCVGDEEVAQFQARGVGSLKVAWTKVSNNAKEPKTSGVIEGIEDEVETVDTLGLVRRDKVSKTHTVPLRLIHDKPGIYTVSLTSVTDSLHNTYTPSGHSAQKVYNVIPKMTANLQCSSPFQLLVNKTISIPVIINGAAYDSTSAKEIAYSFRSLTGAVSTHSMKLSRKNELITVSEPGTYTLQDLTGQCSGGIIEPSSCRVQLISPPALDMTVITLNEG